MDNNIFFFFFFASCGKIKPTKQMLKDMIFLTKVTEITIDWRSGIEWIAWRAMMDHERSAKHTHRNARSFDSFSTVHRWSVPYVVVLVILKINMNYVSSWACVCGSDRWQDSLAASVDREYIFVRGDEEMFFSLFGSHRNSKIKHRAHFYGCFDSLPTVCGLLRMRSFQTPRWRFV